MHPSISILEEVVRLARQEFELLEQDDATALKASAEMRGSLLRNAWKEKEGCDELKFVDLLQMIQRLQNKLGERAESIMAEVRHELDEARDGTRQRKTAARSVLSYCRAGLDRPKTSARIFRKFS